MQINHQDEPSLVPPRAERLYRAECEQNTCKNLPHQLGLDPFRHFSPSDAPEKHAGDQQYSCLPRYISFFRVRHQRQNSRRRNQSNQGSALRAVLAEGKKQPQERHQNDAATNAKHSRSNSAHARNREDSRVASHFISHEISPGCRRPRSYLAASFSRAGMPPASGNIRMLLSSAVTAWEARSGSPHRRRKASPARRECPPSNRPDPVSNIPGERPGRW